ncbi:hypothetical protein B9N43_03295 [Denitratisoma sp. DHT3]|uniref:protein phosphatase CheZ n=1 Tax=Denitratisoma sp. DHT3 TaxID=1981880 RepID=UPI001198A268|nr:protein phosphatase CheZ [Denitratisoma sp. DHT3]QDX80373.1 hypothetical protein B9N43_03295 [Denitratisoma sp. DHT3]
MKKAAGKTPVKSSARSATVRTAAKPKGGGAPAARKTAAKPNAGTRAASRGSVSGTAAKAKAPAAAPARKTGATGDVLKELKSLAKELSRTAKGLGTKSGASNPAAVANILGNVERMTADAATRSLQEAEAAKHQLTAARDSLGKDWSRKELEAALRSTSDHLTNIIVAQEFQDLAGQAIRKAMKALVGAIIVVEGNAADDGRLSQSEVDKLLDVLNK